ncbi:MAG: hypothetical protein IKI73_05645 [Firmicutes bacterium]|nr:hypothetical protein [Bacillota bacterium]MBR6236257.1 hypothetical protein [Bacillota bacterium]
MSRYNHVPPQGPNNRPQQNSAPKMPSIGKTIAKVAVGALFIVIGLDDFRDFTFFMFCLVIGAALIAWGLIPYMQAKRNAEKEETERILSTPFPGQGEAEEDEAERLAKKYYNK